MYKVTVHIWDPKWLTHL